MIRQHNTSNQVQHFCQQVFILLALLMTSISGVKAADYVFMYNSYFLANGSTPTTTFVPNASIYTGTSGTRTIRNADGYYLAYSSGSSTNQGNYDISIGSNGYVYLTDYTNYYLNMQNPNQNSRAWRFSNTTNNRAIAYTVTTNSVPASLSDFTINSGNTTLSATGTYNYGHSNASYIQAHTHYSFSTYNYYSTDPSQAATTNSPTGTSVTAGYTWSLDAKGADASVNTSNGTITVNALPTSDITMTLTCSVTSNGLTKSASKEITIQGTTPSAPTISVSGTSVTLSTTAAGTTTIRYTLDGTDPTASTGTVYSGAIDLSSSTTSPVTIKAVTVRNGNASAVTTQQVTLTLPEPVITVNAEAGTATISATAGATIYYTTDGSTPTTSSSQYSGSLSGLAAMTTVNAIAIKDGWNNSPMASETVMIPSGVSGGTVTLFDYEDHRWTYYSGVDASVDNGNYNTNYAGKLYSPNPRNVKITYKANGGAVSISESETEFVYYKTLEQGTTTGQYPYTVISNPFSKRPNGKGFGGWRIKEGAQYINGYNDEDVLPLDADIVFTNLPYPSVNSTSAEIEFEATWVNLNNIVRRTGTGNYTYSATGGTYETNILVIQSNHTGTITASSPVTIMMVEPDGSADYRGTYTFSGNITPNNDEVTKIEWARWTTTGTINATGRNFTIGRGILRPNGGGSLVGSNSNRNINQTFKVESGIYETFYAIGANGPANNMTKQHIILGNDYDRAKSNNDNLTITDNMMLLNRATAIGTDRLVVTSKSGKFTTELDHSTAQASGNCFYLWNNGSTNTATGVRTLVIEGGEFWHIAGGVDYSNSNDEVNLKIRMKGGTVHGSIYGGAARYDAHGGKQFVFTGGTIEGWIAGGSNGFLSAGTGTDNGSTQGNSYIYVGGITHVDSHGNNTAINVALGGNVYGAGCGNEDVNVSGRVTLGTNVVIADDCYVERGVYGGGAYGSSPETANVYITGNAHVDGVDDPTFGVQGGVYGGARAKGGGSTNIYMTGGLIEPGLYGGSNKTGTLTGSVTMQINGGQVGTSSSPGNIHGGGYGQPTRVSQNVDITLGTTTQTIPGVTVYGDVYGGSALGYVNGTAATNTYHTNVTMNKGVINGSLYGGGLGDGSNAANVYGPVAVKVYGGSVNTTAASGSGAVYGCNNLNGAPQRAVTVDIYGTDPAPSADTYALDAVYGGGNQADYSYGTPTVKVHNCDNSIAYVYGGGNAAHITNGNTDVTIYGGNKIGNVFGGGNGTVTAANVSGNTNVKIYGGTIGRVFGGSNSRGNIGGTINVTVTKGGEADTDPDGSSTACAMHIDEVYGGGNMAASDAGNITIGCTGAEGEGIGDVYGGANAANITGDISLEITGGSIERVFGGNNASGSISGGIQVDINWDTTNPCGYNHLGSVFGAGNLAQYTIPSGKELKVNILNGTVSGNVYGGGAGNLVDGSDRGVAGTVTGSPTVTIGDSEPNHTAIVLGDVYGGGDAADVAGTPVIVVNDCNTEIGYLYGGGNAADVDGTNITVNGGTIHHDAFGGGHGDKDASSPSKYADVKGDVVFNVYGGTIDRVFAGSNSKGDITGTSALTINKTGTCDMKIREAYGGGNQAAGNAGSVTIGCTGAIVTGDAGHAAHPENIGTTLEGIGTVYGGANQANIGKEGTPSNITLNINSGMVANVFGGNNTSGTIYGTIEVNIEKTSDACGWYVGNVFGGGNLASYTGSPAVNVKNGAVSLNVYGGGKGASAVVTGNPVVTVGDATQASYSAIVGGDVYGGGDAAAVTGNTTVTYNDNNASSTVGNLFGGGNAAGVSGTSTVTLTNGKVTNGVYGGCNAEGSVGVVTIALNGGQVGTDASHTADVYGGGLGANTTTTGNIDVTLNGTTVYGDLYGGSALGSVNAADADPANLTTLTISSNTLHGTIYGGGKGSNEGDGTTATSNGNVQIDYNTANTNLTGLYGGANVNGLVKGNIVVNVLANVGASGNKVNVFGGGLGQNTNTNGNVSVNVGDATQNPVIAPTIYGDIYGGSALGNVNSGTEDYTRVNLNAGTIHGDAYGGGLGQLADNSASPAIPAIAALVNGNVTVTQNGVTFVTGYASETNPDGTQIVNAGRIFGCNNLNGSPQGTVLVLVNKTSNAPTLGTYDMEAVYGGGNLAAYAPATATLTATGQFTSYDDKNGDPTAHVAANKPLQVVVNGCDNVSVGYVYGGGNAAPTPSTDVLILGAKEIGYVFGGGNGKDKVLKNGTWGNNPGADVGINGGTEYGTGDAYTSIFGGTIHEAYGASNQKGTIKGNINLDVREGVVSCALAIDKIVGAGKNADVDGDCILVMGCMPSNPKTQAVFGGADNANVNGNVELTITSGSFGQVFGGNNLGGIIKGHIKVNIEETGCNPIVIDDLYLGGNQAAYSIFGYYEDGTLTDGRTKYSPRTSADDTHTAVANPATDATHAFPYAQPVLNVISCTSIGKVFGGGLGTGAAMYANPTVNVNMVQGQYYTALPVNENNPNKLGAVENVYGGGNEAAVYGNTKVNIGTEIGNPIAMESSTATPNVLGAYITGTVYGAGKGVETDPDAAIVTGNTQVNMAGGHISRSIYGGGELGSVGTFTETYTTQELHPYHAVGEPKTCKEGTGLTEVKISGGQVGLVRQLMPDPSRPTSDDDYGYVFCACKGVSDSVTYAKANLLAICGSSHLVISDNALIAASVYGGSENGQVLGDTYVEIKGGQIGTGYDKANSTWDAPYTDAQWTAAINAIKSGVVGDINTAVAPFHECDSWPFDTEGDRHVYDYFHGTAGYDSKGAGNPGSDGHSYYGHVFGGGSGYYPFAAGKWRRTAGRVNGNTVVEISGGHVLTNVYGGNEITDVLGSSKVEMWGGTVGVPRTIPGIQARPVNSYIFGAGMGDPRVLFNGWSNVGSAEVIVRGDAVVFGSVFGGGEDGHVLGDVSTTIKGDALIGTFGSSGVDGNIFGSGRGFSALALTAGAVCGNVTVNIAERAKILGSIFGGGRMAAVGTYLALETDANYGKLIAEGQDPYGTGSTTHGNVTINITGGTIGNLSQMDSPNSIGDVFGGSKGVLMSEWAKTQKLGLVKNTTVNISQAAGYTTTIYGNVYGGGELASVGSYNYATTAEASTYSTNHPSEPMTEGDVLSVLESGTGLAKILITGGTIGQNTTTDTHGNVFGGCLGKAGTAYSGYSFVNNSDVTLDGGTVYGCVFGGGENGHVFSDTDVKIKSGSVGIALDKANLPDADLNANMIYRGNVYGGGRGIDKTTGGNYSITAGKVNGNTNVEVTGGIIYRNVYGGGSLASVGILDVEDNTNGNATVTIKGGQIGTDGGASANNYNTLIPDRESRRENGFVFGSGRGMAAGNTNPELARLAYTKNTIVSIEGTANVTGSVFGGGENGHVKYDTKVYVKENSLVGTELIDAEHTIDDNGRGRLLYRGNVYGGGRGIDTGDAGYSLTAGRVYGNTFVEVSGGKIYHDVFGGGSLASVGNETVNPTTGEVTYGDTSGETEVHIKGGIIGYSSTASKQGFNCGFVYGGCRGLSAPSNSDIVKMAYVHNTKVYIEQGADVKGSVFGGGANGHVKNDTYVEISGGSIGTALLADEVGFDDHGVAVKPVFRGNVYAGGRGVDQYYTSGSSATEGKYSLSAGAVYGNAELLMTGGQVWHNVYGSGAMASVGTVKAKATGQHVHDEVVDGSGNLVNNVIYNPDESDINYLTGVFKEGTGKVTVTITGGTVGDTTPGHEGRNNGRVYGAGRGVSADRSDYVASMEYVNETDVTIGTSGQQPSSYSGSTPDALNYPYIYGAVFGGGENGHVKTNTDVKIYSGIIGFPLVEGSSQEYKTAADGSSKNPYRGNVFGGGRGVDPVHHGTAEQRSSSAGRVYGRTNVTMKGGVVRRAIYGGGLLASVGVYRLLVDDMHITGMIEDEEDGGDATVTISGGYIGNVNPDGTALSGTNASGIAYLVPGDNNGHVFGSSCGMVADNYIDPVSGLPVDVQYRQMGYSHSTHVSISGNDTRVFGSVFGSGENGHVWEDTRIDISGGEIGYQTNSSTFIYAGNVYGSGRGVDHPHSPTGISETAGKVRGNTTVNLTGGIVWRDVYGGGSLASVGEADETAADSKKNITSDPTTNNPFPYSTGLTRVVIDGTSAVHGSVYGSGRGVASTSAVYKQAAYVKNTLVTVKGSAHVFQNVFGGGNAGHVRKNTDVTIDGSSKVDGNVYGGGAGDISSPTAGLVNHDVAVNIKGGLIAHDVYGGGAIANSNVHDVRNTAVTECTDTNRGNAKTLVNLTGGIILGDAYGGGQGVIPSSGATAAEIANAAALVQGDVTLTLDGTAFYPTKSGGVATSGRVFGCNNLNGTPQGTVFVKVLQTKGVTESGGTYSVNDTKPTLDTDTYEVQAVYGGGNLAAYEPWDAAATGQYTTGVVAASNPLQVLIDGCDKTSIEYVYGGGNAASAPSTQVIVRGAYELGTVFGGGNGKDALPNGDPNPGAHVGFLADGTTPYSSGSGNANVYLYGGYIHNAFGASNTLGNIAGKAEVHIDEAKEAGVAVCPLILDEVYGGGNEAYMAGGTDIDMGCITYLKAIYGGAKNADVGGDINLTITSGHFDRVFGGNNIGGVINGSITVNIEETGCNPITIGELYGCGNQARYTTPGSKHPTINVKSFTSIGRIFGGGLGASAVVTGNPTVNINEIVGEHANNTTWNYHQQIVNGEAVGKTITFSDGTSVTMPTHETGKIGAIGTVFGGGNAAQVVGNTNLNIGTASTINYSSDATGATGRPVIGVDIRGNVFGGGNQAEVTGKTNVIVGK